MNEIGFVGLGKLGLESAEVFARHYRVRGHDIYPRVSDSVEITDLATVVNFSDWIFIAVPTPHAQGYDGSRPSSHLEPKDFSLDDVRQTLIDINGLARKTKKIVLISTVLPGSMRRELDRLVDARHHLIYNPYLIAMGSVKWDMVNPDMVIMGSRQAQDPVLDELINLYRPMMQNNPRYVTGTWEEAECVKIFYNTFISAKVAMVNMIQDFAQKIGNIDVDVVTDALAGSTMRIMGPKYMTAGMGDAGACHPRDNIALRWLAQQHDLGYDLFDAIMRAREQQAQNLAGYLCDLAEEHDLPIVIHGKAYKPGVPFCVGSYSTLIGHYVQQQGHSISYIDPLADDVEHVIQAMDWPAVILLAHNSEVTYGYTGSGVTAADTYCEIPAGSVVVDPWRRYQQNNVTVIHYGRTR